MGVFRPHYSSVVSKCTLSLIKDPPTRTRTQTLTHTYRHKGTHTDTQTQTHTYIYTHTDTNTQTDTYTHVHTRATALNNLDEIESFMQFRDISNVEFSFPTI